MSLKRSRFSGSLTFGRRKGLPVPNLAIRGPLDHTYQFGCTKLLNEPRGDQVHCRATAPAVVSELHASGVAQARLQTFHVS